MKSNAQNMSNTEITLYGQYRTYSLELLYALEAGHTFKLPYSFSYGSVDPGSSSGFTTNQHSFSFEEKAEVDSGSWTQILIVGGALTLEGERGHIDVYSTVCAIFF